MGVISSLINGALSFPQQFLNHHYNMMLNEMNNQANLELTRETNQANKELSELAYHQNVEQWNRENAYNTPAVQMQRYKDAGLNPNLIYGQSNLSASSPTMSYHPQTNFQRSAPPFANFGVNFSPFDIIKDIYDFSTLADKMEQSRSQTEIMKYQAEIQKSVSKMQALESDFKLSQLQGIQETTKATLNKIGLESDRLLQDIANGEVSRKEAEARIKKINEESKRVREEIKNARKQRDIIDAQISNYNADLDLKKQSYSHNEVMNPLIEGAKRIENSMKEFDEVLKSQEVGLESRKGQTWLMAREAIKDLSPLRLIFK